MKMQEQLKQYLDDELGIAYMIPGRQLNAPLLGMWAGRAAQFPRLLRESFSPSTQAVLLWCLLKKRNLLVDSTMIRDETGYSRITVNCLMNEIEMLLPELVSISQGRKFIIVEEAKPVWMKAKAWCDLVGKARECKAEKFQSTTGLSCE